MLIFIGNVVEANGHVSADDIPGAIHCSQLERRIRRRPSSDCVPAIRSFEGVDIWGFSEVQNDADSSVFETAAEDGENANFERITGTMGGDDRLTQTLPVVAAGDYNFDWSVTCARRRHDHRKKPLDLAHLETSLFDTPTTPP